MKKLTKKELENKSLSARIKRRGKTGDGNHNAWVKTTTYGSYKTDSQRMVDREREKRRQQKLGRESNDIKLDANGNPMYIPKSNVGHKNTKFADGHQRLNRNL